jgi:hypothetical protein
MQSNDMIVMWQANAAVRSHGNGGAYKWEPVVMEAARRLGKGAMHVINRLAKIASGSDGNDKHVFVRRAQEALSVARVRGNGYV